MSDSYTLLRSKVQVPQAHPGPASKRELIDALGAGFFGVLIPLKATACCGKAVRLAQWTNGSFGEHVGGWVTPDTGVDERTRLTDGPEHIRPSTSSAQFVEQNGHATRR